jgi:hypothetical protein
MSIVRRTPAPVALIAFLAAGCAGGASPSAASASVTSSPAASSAPGQAPSQATSEAPASPSPSPAPVTLPSTPLAATLDQSYASPGLESDTAKMGGLTPRDLVAQWYQADGSYVVAYVGWNLTATGPLCPGNSIQIGSGFQHVTNMPTAEGACEGVATLAQPPIGPRICGDQVLYLTAIPAGTKGILWASINSQQPDGTYVGLAGTVDGTTDEAPSIDLDALGCRPAI